MRVLVRDWDAVRRVTPVALSAYARAHGWAKTGTFGDHADIYGAEDRSEILIPRTSDLGDYASTVTRLLEIFSETADVSQVRVHHDLTTADRDVIRVRAEGDGWEVSVADRAALIEGARDLVFAAACSVERPRALHRAGANREAARYLRRVCLGHTEPGGFVVTLVTPAVSPVRLDPDRPAEEPFARTVSRRLLRSLLATRRAVEATAAGEAGALADLVEAGVSANLCEAIAGLTEAFDAVDIGVSWALTSPAAEPPGSARFIAADSAVVREAARSYRAGEPEEVSLVGFVSRLGNGETEREREVVLQAREPDAPGRRRTVTAVLGERDYDRAIEAHRGKLAVIARGDLQRIGSRWHLQSPRIVEVLRPEEKTAKRG